MIQTLRRHHFRLTPQRLEIVKVLAVSEGHPTAEQVYDKVRKKFPTTSLATVYRNILKLKELGEVLELGFAEGGNRYDGNKPYDHPHIVCLKCKKILDPELPQFQDLTRELEKSTGFQVINHRLDFFGICPKCRAKR